MYIIQKIAGGMKVTHWKAELIGKLSRSGFKQACGKLLEEATLDELKDEWGRYSLLEHARRKRCWEYRD
jgi:hypothetical protein